MTGPAPNPPLNDVPAATGLVRVELFAGMAQAAGCRSLDLAWPGGDVALLRRRLASERPEIALLLARSTVAIGGRYAADAEQVAHGAAVAIIPPVSGG